MVIEMSIQLDWNLTFPIQDDVLPDNTLIIKSRGTSGAGQFEIAGNANGASGNIIKAKDVIDHYITFAFHRDDGKLIHFAEKYPVQQVGGKVRVSVKSNGESRPNIGNLFTAFFLLPDVSQREKSIPFNNTDLLEKSFWIDDVSCRVLSISDDSIILEPVQFVFASSNKDKANQFSGMAIFDFHKRISDIVSVCRAATCRSSGAIKAAFTYFKDVFDGKTYFKHDEAILFKKVVANWLEEKNTNYHHSNDFLPILLDEFPMSEMNMLMTDLNKYPRNWIFFGAPGTGKSHELNRIAEESFSEENISRVTFYPDYTYSQFVGCFKPITEKTVENGESVSHITYRYVLGPFLKTYVEACKHPDQNYLLIVEEINRANPAAVFGDIFQLLDRREDGCSEYSIATPEEMSDQLKEVFKNESIEADKLAIPSNMYIWATMNSADQGVFPMDTAFKRRWDFRYMGIDEGEDKIVKVRNGDVEEKKRLDEINISCGKHVINWNEFRKAINNFMMSDSLKVNEDKLLGPFFVSPSALNEERFADVFKDKVILYLYEDACKTKHQKMFRSELKTYAQICDAFDDDDAEIFADGFDASAIYVTDENGDQTTDGDDDQSEAAE